MKYISIKIYEKEGKLEIKPIVIGITYVLKSYTSIRVSWRKSGISKKIMYSKI